MVELREIRAKRLGFTFRRTLRRDPFRFVSENSFLLLILYGITRPKPGTKKTTGIAAGPGETAAAAGTSSGAGKPWGNDEPDAPVQPRRPSQSGLIWPTKRYQDPSPWELLQRHHSR